MCVPAPPGVFLPVLYRTCTGTRPGSPGVFLPVRDPPGQGYRVPRNPHTGTVHVVCIANQKVMNAPVCTLRPWDNASCSSDKGVANAWMPYAAPRRMVYLLNMSCVPNDELGRDHMWLPVSHTRAPQKAVGLWLYYMRGCSDLGYNVGRTLAVRNRCHAALEIDQRLHGDGDEASIDRVARYLLQRVPKYVQRLVNLPFVRAVATKNASLEALAQLAVQECARGVYQGCIRRADDVCNGTCAERLDALGPIAGHNAFDFLNAESLRKLHSRQALDSIQLLQQPQGGSGKLWTVEIWDVRGLQPNSQNVTTPRGNSSTALAPEKHVPSLGPQFGWLNGSACVPSTSSHSCMACHQSQTRAACSFGCSRAGHLSGQPLPQEV